MNIKVHVVGVRDGMVKEGEEPGALFSGILEVNGQLIEEVDAIEVMFREGFVTVNAHLIPGAFEVVTHTGESWEQMLQQISVEQVQRAATGRALARTKDG